MMNRANDAYISFIEENNLESRLYLKGSYLFQQGDVIDAVYFIKKGGVCVLHDGFMLWSAGNLEIVGITSYLSTKSNYCFTAKLGVNSEIYRVPIELMDKSLKRDPKFSRIIIVEICKRIQRLDQRVKIFGEKSSFDRLVDVLVDHGRVFGKQCLSFSLKELAEMIAVSSRSVRSMIKELESRQLIRKVNRELEIVDLRGLEIIGKYSRGGRLHGFI